MSKNSFLTKLQHFHEFFVQNFFDNFSREIKVVDSQKVQKPQHFHEFFTQKNRLFSREIKVDFLDKNEDFEQCEIIEFSRQKSNLK